MHQSGNIRQTHSRSHTERSTDNRSLSSHFQRCGILTKMTQFSLSRWPELDEKSRDLKIRGSRVLKVRTQRLGKSSRYSKFSQSYFWCVDQHCKRSLTLAMLGFISQLTWLGHPVVEATARSIVELLPLKDGKQGRTHTHTHACTHAREKVVTASRNSRP